MVPSRTFADPLGAAGVGSVVFGTALLLAAPSVGWLDGGELVAGAWDLGVSHPPGQPLPTLVWRLAMLLPVASIPFRATLVSCACAALACVPLILLARSLVGETRTISPSLLSWLVCVPAILGFASLSQATRTEVYSMQLLLALSVLAAAAGCHRGESGDRGRSAVVLVLLLGLSGATHPLLAVALVPAALLGLAGALRGIRIRIAVLAGAAAALTAGIQLYLPLRSAARPELAWGMPHTPGAFVAVLTGQSFAQNFSPSDGGMVGHNVGVVFDVLLSDIGAGFVLLAILGLGATLLHGRRVVPGILALAMLGNVATVVLQNKVFGSNPDLHGYLALTTALAGLLGGVGLILALTRLASSPRLPRPAPVGWALVVGLLLLQAPVAWRADLSRNHEPERLARAQQDALPPGAVLVTSGNSSAFVGSYLERVERRRPDLAVFHRILLGHEFYELHLRQLHGSPPAGLDTRALRGSATAALAGGAPVVAVEIREPDLAHAANLVPAGRVMRLGGGPAALEGALARHDVLARRWRPTLDDPGFLRDAEAQGLLLYERLLRASYYRERGRDDLMRGEAAAAGELAPGETLVLPEPAGAPWWRTP